MSLAARFSAWLFAIALVALPLVAVLNGWFAAERWPLQRLRLTAEFQRVDADAVRATVQPHLARGFFAIDLAALQRDLAALPWVASAEVRKAWPDRLDVQLREHQAFARWGQDRLVSTRGALFAVPTALADSGLPRLHGPDDRVADVVNTYQAADALLRQHGLRLAGLRLSPRGSWTLELGDGAQVMVGRGDPRPRLARFVPLLPGLAANEARSLERADLRYGNGFALRWKATDQDSQAPAAQPAADGSKA